MYSVDIYEVEYKFIFTDPKARALARLFHATGFGEGISDHERYLDGGRIDESDATVLYYLTPVAERRHEELQRQVMQDHYCDTEEGIFEAAGFDFRVRRINGTAYLTMKEIRGTVDPETGLSTREEYEVEVDMDAIHEVEGGYELNINRIMPHIAQGEKDDPFFEKLQTILGGENSVTVQLDRIVSQERLFRLVHRVIISPDGEMEEMKLLGELSIDNIAFEGPHVDSENGHGRIFIQGGEFESKGEPNPEALAAFMDFFNAEFGQHMIPVLHSKSEMARMTAEEMQAHYPAASVYPIEQSHRFFQDRIQGHPSPHGASPDHPARTR